MSTSITKLGLLAVILSVLTSLSLKAQSQINGSLSASGTITGSVSNGLGLDAAEFGLSNYATGPYSACLGIGNTGSSYGSIALGYYNTAAGSAAAAFNNFTQAPGAAASSFGNYTYANAAADFVIGQYNIGAYTTVGQTGVNGQTTWFAGNSAYPNGDPVFEIGNGTKIGTTVTPNDAFIVYKSGNAWVQGTISAHVAMRTAPSGDLSMGTYTAGTAP